MSLNSQVCRYGSSDLSKWGSCDFRLFLKGDMRMYITEGLSPYCVPYVIYQPSFSISTLIQFSATLGLVNYLGVVFHGRVLFQFLIELLIIELS